MDGHSAFEGSLAPSPLHEFLNDAAGDQPKHRPAATAGAPRLLSWEQLNYLLGVRGHWNDQHLMLVIDGQKLPSERYCDMSPSLRGPEWRADPAKVQSFLAIGATLIGNMAEDVSPDLKKVADVISGAKGGLVTANIYASFKGVAGFGPHYDTTDVIAFQCEGEKVWRIYEGRADNPTKLPTGADGVIQEEQRRAAGRLVETVTMRPGDMLYVPRGRYHDAVTESDTSLHVTFAVTQLTGRVLLRTLDQVAQDDSAFRAFIPDAGVGEEAAFRAHLLMLANRLRELALSPEVVNEMRRRQRALRIAAPDYQLPLREPVHAFRATGAAIEVSRAPPLLRVNRAMIPVQGLEQAALWLANATEFTDLELYGRFNTLRREDLARLVEMLERAGAFRAV
jgi:lysine-specific demethylase/histidyl-hydroxylase NO66